MDHLVVVTHPHALQLEARPLETEGVPEGAVALGYYHEDHLLARGVVAPEAVDAIHGLLAQPTTIALAAAEDEHGNIDARVCLVLPIDPDLLSDESDPDEPEEPWKASLPSLPSGIESAALAGAQEDQPRIALLPIGNVIRSRGDRRHPDDVGADVREMLDNLVSGRARDSVQKAIDDLLKSL